MTPDVPHTIRSAPGLARLARRLAAPAIALVLALAALAACKPADGAASDLRSWTDDLAFRISTQPMPPRAREDVLYKVVIRDKKTGNPVEGGEGRIFATSRDGANTWDALTPGPEPGTYYGKLRYITSGDWAIAIQFRRDSLQVLQRIDWMQGVRQSTTTSF
ncbi:MAG: hypothetical protein HY275_00815 [Gemmatimonadetes bacterium]|nr:hypothetical protein [Gemmatimonadota bacterium]